MIAVEVYVNGQHVCTAGEEDLSVLACHLDAVGYLGNKSCGVQGQDEIAGGYEIGFSVGGLGGNKNRRHGVV